MQSLSNERLVQIQSLLAYGQYGKIAQIIASIALNEQKNNIEASSILRAAEQVSLTCEEVHSNLTSHQIITQNLVEQEASLKEHLQKLLQIANQAEGKTAVLYKQSNTSPRIDTKSVPPNSTPYLKRWIHKLANLRLQSALNSKIVIEHEDDTGSNARFPIEKANPQATEVISPPILDTSPINDQSISSPQSIVNRTALIIYCLGRFRVFQNDQAINNWKSNKGVSVLKYLVTQTDKPISKEILMDVFWPDADMESARRNLHQAVYSLRQALRQHHADLEYIRYENDNYMLNPEIDFWIDYEEFEHRVSNGRYLEKSGHLSKALAEYGIAEGLYQGNFLEENLYDDWVTRKREFLLNQYLSIAIQLIRHYRQQKEYTAAISLCHKLLNFDPAYEPAHRQLITCFLAQGQRHLAVRQYQTCIQILQDELGIEPDEKTNSLYQKTIISAQAI